MFAALPPYVRHLILLTLVFAALIAALIFTSDRISGYEGLTYVLFAMLALGLWAAICLLYSIVVLIRDGWRKSSVPAVIILLTALIIGASWASRLAG